MFEEYTPTHRLELERLLQSEKWQRVISSGLVPEVKAGRIEPGKTRNFIDTVVNQLLGWNEERIKRFINEGCRDRDYLYTELSKWPPDLRHPALSFIGLNLTADCNSNPRCTYCNQPYTPSLVGLEEWKGVIEEVTGNGEGPYVYITGGEPLTLKEIIWGDNGLIRFATQRGAGVNVNTNATMLTPEIALNFIKAGLAKVHISLDTSNREVQIGLRGHFDEILKGIYNVQIARELVGVSYPVIHTNCVLTNRNIDLFPELFAFILEKRKQVPRADDLFTHIIPVGGNEGLRPSEAQFRRFYGNTWPHVCQMWSAYQEKLGVPKDKRVSLGGFFSNPFLRVEHKGGFDAYVKASAEGRYGKLALSQHCYVAPTQAVFTPDGCQYRCGSHAIRRILPIGNIRERGVFENISAGMSCLPKLPQEEHCYGCALATLYINQSVERKLKEKLEAMISGKG